MVVRRLPWNGLLVLVCVVACLFAAQVVASPCTNIKGSCLDTKKTPSTCAIGHTWLTNYCPDDPASIKCCAPIDPAPPCSAVGRGRNSGPAGSSAGTREQKIQRVIAAARSMIGKGLSYAWGGGGKGGPSCGITSPSPSGLVDSNRFGFDCSGFAQYAFWLGAGVDIGADTNAQARHGSVLAYSARQPGDLLFWGDLQGTTTHVAIYVGADQMLEAAPPRGANSVHQTAVYGTHNHVVRIL